MNETARIIRAWRWRRRDYAVTQALPSGPVTDVVRTCSSLRALRRVALIRGATVRVNVPIIVHARRAWRELGEDK